MKKLSELIQTLTASDKFTFTECHATASEVCEVLSGQKVAKPETGTLATLEQALADAAKGSKNAVYRVDVPACGHSFALAQEKKNIVLLQAWEGCYSLPEWLAGTAESVKKNAWLPKKGGGDYTLLTTYLTTMSTALAAGKDGDVVTSATSLFNPTGKKVTLLKVSVGAAKGKALEVLWAQKTF